MKSACLKYILNSPHSYFFALMITLLYIPSPKILFNSILQICKNKTYEICTIQALDHYIERMQGIPIKIDFDDYIYSPIRQCQIR